MKLMTLNLRHDANRWPERAGLIVEELMREQPDVIALQEVALSIEQAHFIARQLALCLPGQQYSVLVEPKRGLLPKEGIAFLSRLPVVEHARIDLPEGKRVAQYMRVEQDGQPYDIVNLHLHHRPHDNESVRLPQIQHVLGWMYTGRQPMLRRWIVAGDFNAAPGSAPIASLRKHLESAYAAVHGREPEYTAPTPLRTEEYGEAWVSTIDYIFFDPAALRVETARLAFNQPDPDDETLYPSDHFGLVAEFAPPG